MLVVSSTLRYHLKALLKLLKTFFILLLQFLNVYYLSFFSLDVFIDVYVTSAATIKPNTTKAIITLIVMSFFFCSTFVNILHNHENEKKLNPLCAKTVHFLTYIKLHKHLIITKLI